MHNNLLGTEQGRDVDRYNTLLETAPSEVTYTCSFRESGKLKK